MSSGAQRFETPGTASVSQSGFSFQTSPRYFHVVPSLDDRIWMLPSATFWLPVEYTYSTPSETA